MIWTAVETWGREAILLVVFIVLARLLGPGAIGLVVLAMSAPLIFVIPVEQGIPDAIVQRPELEDLHVDSAFWFLLALGATLSLLIWASAGLVAAALGEPALQELVQWTSLIVFITAIGAIPSAILKRRLQFRLFALRTAVGTVVGGIIGVAMALTGFGVWSLVAMNLSRATVESAYIFWASEWRPRPQFSFGKCLDLFGFAAPIVAQSFLRIVNDEIPKLAIGTFLSPSAVGIYALARRPVNLLTNVLVSPIRRVTMPAVSRLQDDPARIDRFFEVAVRMATVISVPAYVGIAAIAPLLVPVVLGREWVPAVTAIQILLSLGLIRSIDGICVHLILAMGHSRLLLLLHVSYMIMAAILFPLAAHISLNATMLAIVACNFALLPIFLFKVQELAGVNVLQPLRALPRIILAAAVMYVAVDATQRLALGHTSPILVLVASILVGIIVYGGATSLLVRDDLVMARDLLRRLRGAR